MKQDDFLVWFPSFMDMKLLLFKNDQEQNTKNTGVILFVHVCDIVIQSDVLLHIYNLMLYVMQGAQHKVACHR